MLTHLNPVQYASHIFGGSRPLSRALGKHYTAASRWKRCCQGFFPELKIMRRVLEVAQERGLDLTPSDLLFGRDVSVEIADQSPV